MMPAASGPFSSRVDIGQEQQQEHCARERTTLFLLLFDERNITTAAFSSHPS
ncbi:unnamed protein product [Amoebophrya sp. A25]|nr:unnamed protein product [Amoebophrya sp. A25]|eukprot:GSA25T00007146001.1